MSENKKNTPKGVVREWIQDRADDLIFWIMNITLEDILMFVNILCATISILCFALYFVVKWLEY